MNSTVVESELGAFELSKPMDWMQTLGLEPEATSGMHKFIQKTDASTIAFKEEVS